MAQTIVDIPDECMPELEPYKERLGELLLLGLAQMKTREALRLYQQGAVSFGRAAELAGLSRQEMIQQARALDVQPRWGMQMVREELA